MIEPREVPVRKGDLAHVRKYVKNGLRLGRSLKDIQESLEKMHGKEFGWFMQSWADHHSEGVVRYTERYRNRLNASPNMADADNNWRAR